MQVHERSLAVFPATTKAWPSLAEGGRGEAWLIKLLGGINILVRAGELRVVFGMVLGRGSDGWWS